MSSKSTEIRAYMTPNPYSIGSEQPLRVAYDLMATHGIRHLPVLHGGKLVGIVSQRDLALIESLPGVDPDEVSVEDAMTQDIYTTSEQAPLAEVAREMSARKLGCTIITRRSDVVGVFTTVDALRALADQLDATSA